MKRTGDDIRSLVGLLDSDVAHLGALVDENTRAGERIKKGADDPLDYAALGYTVHNLYSLIENYMLRIAKTFENSLDATSWHTDLLDRMAAEVRESGRGSLSPPKRAPSMSFELSAMFFATCIEAA